MKAGNWHPESGSICCDGDVFGWCSECGGPNARVRHGDDISIVCITDYMARWRARKAVDSADLNLDCAPTERQW